MMVTMSDRCDGLASARIDRWLWSVRICATRLVASGLCRQGRVLIDRQLAKPSRVVKPGQTVAVQYRGISRQYRVLRCVQQRVSPPLAMECKEEITPEEEWERWRAARSARMPTRSKGMGRPTKKDRRDLENFLGC